MSRRYKGGVISATAPVPTGPYQCGTAKGIWTLPQQMQAIAANIWPIAGNVFTPPGQQAYTTIGTFTYVVPAGVTSVSVVTVGAGSPGGRGGGGGGALAYSNNIAVTPAESLTVLVADCNTNGGASVLSALRRSSTNLVAAGSGVRGGLGCPIVGGDGGTVIAGTGYSGGKGGNGNTGGGGGASGYAGNGGAGGVSSLTTNGAAGTGGAGGGGGYGGSTGGGTQYSGGAGGGVGILGQGCNGAGGISNASTGGTGGGGGSGGTSGAAGCNCSCGCGSRNTKGGVYGGGGGGGCRTLRTGGVGAVRIIWPGTTRSFPSTCTGNL